MKRLYLLIIFISYMPIWAYSVEIKIASQHGSVFFRKGFETVWEESAVGKILQKNDWIQTRDNSWVKLELENNKIFRVPANALIEVSEVLSYTTSGFVLMLTSLEISSLPPQKSKPLPPSGAFVIHGQAGKQQPAIDISEVNKYLQLELNGLQALSEQSFWTGVVLKALKLKKYGEIVDRELLDFKLIAAYQKLNLVRRFKQAKEQFIKTYPNSVLIDKLQSP